MGSRDKPTLVKELIDICHRLYSLGFVAAMDGNVSVRLENRNMISTRSGVNKGMVTPDDLVEVNTEGAQVSGRGKPSTELPMHLFIYRERKDVNAIVHAHPPYATGFAVARIGLDKPVLPEVSIGLGGIPLASYATPSTGEVPASIAPYVHTHTAILLANHGVVTYGSDPLDAFFRMEKVEHVAHTMFVAAILGGAKGLTPDEVKQLNRASIFAHGIEVRKQG
jgi:L-fuculose-phosphate aldolase